MARPTRTTASCTSGAIDRFDFRASCLGIYDGALVAGDPISNNVFRLFSGFDDDESPITNHWQDGQLNLGTNRLERAHLMRVTGLIQRDQDIAVSLIWTTARRSVSSPFRATAITWTTVSTP